MSTPNQPITLRVSEKDVKRMSILNKIFKYKKHQLKSKLFTALLRSKSVGTIKELSKKSELSKIEREVLEELTLLEG